MLFHELDELAAFEQQELRIFHDDGIARAWLAIEQGKLAEELAGPEDGQSELLAIGGGHADLHAAGLDHVKIAARLAIHEDSRALAVKPSAQAREQCFAL